jgi:adenine/guanine phosphoribosyltransferase-like PRPP-binding protein
MFDLNGAQPPDWMQFTGTRLVAWREVQAMARRHGRTIARDYDLLVAIMRAGSPVAALLAQQTGLPIDYLICSRRNPDPCFLDGEARAPRGRHILLVDDACGSGWTFARCRHYCETLGNRVGTFSVFRCAAPGMFVPDFSMPADPGTYLRWPWEYQAEPEMPAAGRTYVGEPSRPSALSSSIVSSR